MLAYTGALNATGAGLMIDATHAPLNLAQPADALLALRKVHGSLHDSQAVTFHWSGQVWSRIEGERDRLLFKVEGMNVRQCGTLHDAERGTGFRLVSRELMLYLDPTSGQPLQTWHNPWIGREVSVMHVANDPVNLPPFFERDAQGRPFPFAFREQGERVFAPSEIPLFYPNPLAGDYPEYVGNHYHAMEIFDFVADRATLLDRSQASANAALAWVRIAPWLPFMQMGSRPGLMVFNAMGQSVAGVDALPMVLRDAITRDYPEYANPPALDDTRPNATSWTVAKQMIDAQRQAKRNHE
ncbi:DUF1838 family protein [Pseudomonas sp. 8Z]|uniref:DUF1838 family protein n=1 Tax=Pseudomonas sp. 8Z TaxID=2653166 RepID=UPI001358F9FC|nr:DUF1838 family protein [Pseudomonas sp. 8Z]